MLVRLLLSTFYVGFRRTREAPYDGKNIVRVPSDAGRFDADRERLARLSAVKVVPTLLWAVFAGVCLLLSRVEFGDENGGLGHWSITGIAALASGPVAILGGKHAKSALHLIAAREQGVQWLTLGRVVRIATFVFAAVFLATLACGEVSAAKWTIGYGGNKNSNKGHEYLLLAGGHFSILLASFVILMSY
jgi:hypothetical protein